MFDLIGAEWVMSALRGKEHKSGIRTHFLTTEKLNIGPRNASAWVYTRGGEYAVIFKGRPPPVSFYPDLDTARAALVMRGLLEK